MSHTHPPGALQMRDLQPSDLPEVMEIENAAFTSPWQRTTFEGLLRRSDTDLLAVTTQDGLAGYAVCWTILDQSELGNVAVHPDERGRGIGRMLVHAALDRARERGADECYLEVRESNRTAQTLYASCGFETIGRRRRYYTSPVEDALVMRVRL